MTDKGANIVRLTDKNVGRLPAKNGKRTDYTDVTLAGFTLRVSPSGAHRSYSIFYGSGPGRRRFTIGSAKKVTLADARDKAKKVLSLASLGGDPAREKKEQREQKKRDKVADRFEKICDAFVRDQAKEWRPATRANWIRYLNKEIKPALGDELPNDVTPDKVTALLDRIKYGMRDGVDDKGAALWKRKPAPVSARRCFELIRRLCAWAVWKRYMQVSPCVAAKPFEKKRRRDRAAARAKSYTDDQMRSIFATIPGTELDDLTDLIARTAVRAHSARAARFEDIDEEKKMWRVPFHKVGDETGEPHLVPLTKGALRVVRRRRVANLKSGRGKSAWLFPADTSECATCEQLGHMDKPNKAMAAVKAEAGIDDRGLLHRFRDTIKTRMAEHGVLTPVSEHILGHVVAGVEGIYNHAELLPQRREALEWWDSELERILRTKRRKRVTGT